MAGKIGEGSTLISPSDNEERREKTKELGKKAKETFDKYKESSGSKTKEQQKADERTEQVIKDMERGVVRGFNKGGLLSKPKRNPKKPRGKGLGSK